MSHGRRNWWCLLAAVGAIHVSGCATILSGRSSELTVDNSGGPTYFTVYDRQHHPVQSGVTPKKLTLKTSEGPFKPARYSVAYAGQNGPMEQSVSTNVNWWTAGNIVIGGVPGLVVDAASGAMWKLDPRVVGQIPSQHVVSNSVQGNEILAGGDGPAQDDGRSPDSVQPASYGAGQ